LARAELIRREIARLRAEAASRWKKDARTRGEWRAMPKPCADQTSPRSCHVFGNGFVNEKAPVDRLG
jgi:hypothetical protein